MDSTTCVDFLRRQSASPVAAKFGTVTPTDICLSTIVVHELYYGAYRSNDVQKNVLAIEKLIRQFAVLPLHDQESTMAAQIRAELAAKGMPIGPYDLLIAATALVHQLIVVTNNTSEFSRVPGLQFEDWQTT